MTTRVRLSQQEAEQFLYGEAKLLDQRLYDDWLKLFTPDGIYWIPLDEHTDPLRKPSILYDNTQDLAMRIYQTLYTPRWAQRPPSQTMHLISNVMVSEEERPDEVLVTSNMICHELRDGDFRQLGLGIERSIVGRCDYRLRHTAEQGWAIALKKIVLIGRRLPIRNLSFLL